MRAPTVTDGDIALLRALGRRGSVVAASLEVGMTRDRATYRIARLARAFGGPVVTAQRGGRSHGTSQLTPLGARIVRQGFDAVELRDARAALDPTSAPNWMNGRYRRRPVPSLDVGGGLRLRVAFAGAEGERVRAAIDPEAVLVARERFASSARNVLAATVERVRRGSASAADRLVVRAGNLQLRVAVTDDAVDQLRLARGVRVWLYVKATAVRRLPPSIRGSRLS